MANFGWGQTAIQSTMMYIAHKNNKRARAIKEAVASVDEAAMNYAKSPDHRLEFIQEVIKTGFVKDDVQLQAFTEGYVEGAKIPTNKLNILLESLKLKNTIKGVNK